MTEGKEVSEMESEEIKKAIKEAYSKVSSCNITDKRITSGCCGSQSRKYNSDMIESV